MQIHTCEFVLYTDLFAGITQDQMEPLYEELRSIATWGDNNRSMLDAGFILEAINQLSDEDAKPFAKIAEWCRENYNMYVDLEN